MKNKYEVRGETTAIFINRRDGSVLETIIDTTDLPLVQEFPNAWNASWNHKTQSFYVIGKVRFKNGTRVISLQRWLMNHPQNMKVDHFNHDTLDNRRSNLRQVTNAQNMQNRRGATRISKSGIRGVFWDNHANRWVVRVESEGNVYRLGRFKDLDEAARVAKEALKSYLPYSYEALEA